MTKPLFYLVGGLLMALSVAFVVHSILMSDHLWGQIQLMLLCYGLNYVLVTLIFFGLLFTHKKNGSLPILRRYAGFMLLSVLP